MAKLYENSFFRRKISRRRGVWTTWGSAQTWSSWLIRNQQGSAIDALADCSCVGQIADKTEAVLSKTFTPPNFDWSLLVETPYQSWATFAGNQCRNATFESLSKVFPGEVLTTGSVDDFATFYIRLWQSGEMILELVTDGMGWPVPPEDVDDEDDEDYRSIFHFSSNQHDHSWPHSFERCEDAHQQLIIDLDAYIPYFNFDNGALVSDYNHRDAVTTSNESLS